MLPENCLRSYSKVTGEEKEKERKAVHQNKTSRREGLTFKEPIMKTKFYAWSETLPP